MQQQKITGHRLKLLLPFPWGQQQPGTTVFTVSAGGVVVRFDTTL
jgi:hypothetical protein